MSKQDDALRALAAARHSNAAIRGIGYVALAEAFEATYKAIEHAFGLLPVELPTPEMTESEALGLALWCIDNRSTADNSWWLCSPTQLKDALRKVLKQ